MHADSQKIEQSAAWIRRRVEKPPRIGILTGTGLAKSTASLAVSAAFSYADVPFFPVSTVQSHAGKLLFGMIENHWVAVMQGRFHLYEGYAAHEIAVPIRVLKTIGMDTLVLTNAAGGLNDGFKAGDLMLITDHINLTGENPLVGPNDAALGPRFPDMSTAYDAGLADACRRAAHAAHTDLRTGVYAGLKGPSLETPAEIRFLNTIGADAVGFSTVIETIAAVHAGLKVAGLSTITNVHRPAQPKPASVEEIIAVAESAAPRMNALLAALVKQLSGGEAP